jgi:hypothetical protein
MCYNSIVGRESFKNRLTKPHLMWYNIIKEILWIGSRNVLGHWIMLDRLLSRRLENPGLHVKERKSKEEERWKLISTRYGIGYAKLIPWRSGPIIMGT